MTKREIINLKKNEKGFAALEAVTFLMAFIMLTVYVIDFFTAIHTGILGSIAARTYLFETLQHRSNVASFREQTQNSGDTEYNFSKRTHERFHGISDEDQPPLQSGNGQDAAVPVGRVLTQVKDEDQIENDVNNRGLDSGQNRASTIYIKSGYGICVDALCGGGR